MHCPNCGTKNTARAKFCVNCGEELPQLKKGRAEAAAPAPAVQQIVIKQKTNWLNAVFGILLLAILFCVGSVFLMDATETSAATIQQMIAEPQLYFDGLGQLTDQFVAGAKVVLANVGGGDADQNGGQANACPSFSADTAVQEYVDPDPDFQIGYLGFGNTGIKFDQPGLIDSKVSYTPIYKDSATPGKRYECDLGLVLHDDDGNLLIGKYADGNPGFYCGEISKEDMPRNVERYVLSYKNGACQQAFTGIGGLQTTNAGGQQGGAGGQQGGVGNNGDLCAETFYQPPTFQSINWLPADVLNFDVFLPVLIGENTLGETAEGYIRPNTAFDGWYEQQNGNRPIEGIISSAVQLDVNGESLSQCEVQNLSGESAPQGEAGISLACQYQTSREITDYELANITLSAFGCPQPLAIDRFSIPPKELEAYTPPTEEAVACPEGYRRNLKGKCASIDPSQEVACNSGDVYASSEGVCCAPEDYVSEWDSCNSPYYTP